jgi:hypothetical protein
MNNRIFSQYIKIVKPNENFTLTAYVNYLGTYHIIWYDNNTTILNPLGIGNSITLNSSFYEKGDNIYIQVRDNITNLIITDNNNIPLLFTITLDIAEQFGQLTPRYDYVKNSGITDIDSVYFKFNKSLSGVCYTYVRDLNDIYEQNEFVSDVASTGSYNMYSEYDIINEFFSNNYDVEIAVGTNINLKMKYNMIDNVIMYPGTLVLLYGQTNILENGIYIITNNYTLSKVNILNTPEQIYRCKVQVNDGTYKDQEFHVNGYINV